MPRDRLASRWIVFLLVLPAGCAGGAAAERWEYGRVLWDGHPGVTAPEHVEARVAKASAPGPRTLEDCYALALDRSQSLAISGEELVRRRAAVTDALSGLLPRLTAKGSYVRQDEGGLTDRSLGERTEARLQLRQQIFGGLEETQALREATLRRGAMEHALRRARALLYFDVAVAFFAVLQADREVETIRESLRLATERLEELTERHRLGIARRSELLIQEAETESVRARLQELLGVRDVAWEALRFLTGLGPGTELSDGSADPGEPEPLDRFVRVALANRDDLRALVEEAKASEAAALGARSGWLPTVTLEANAWGHREGVSKDVDWDATLGVDVPLFDGLSTAAAAREADSRAREAAMRVVDLERLVQLQIGQAHADVRSLRATLASLEKAVAAARETLELEQAEYRLGIVTNLDVLVALTALERARLDRDRVRFQLKLADVRLAVDAGLAPGRAP